MANEPRADSRDWTGNAKSAFVTLGASNHSANERQHHDFYATSPEAVEQLLALEVFAPNILEPCCGQGHIANVLGKHGYKVTAQDLYDYGYGTPGVDFLKSPPPAATSTSSPTRHIRLLRSSCFTHSKSYRKAIASPCFCGYNSSKGATAIRPSTRTARWRRCMSQPSAHIAP